MTSPTPTKEAVEAAKAFAKYLRNYPARIHTDAERYLVRLADALNAAEADSRRLDFIFMAPGVNYPIVWESDFSLQSREDVDLAMQVRDARKQEGSWMTRYDSFAATALQDSVVNLFARGKYSAREAILILANQKSELVQRVCAMDLLMPKRLVEPNGTEHIYHVPDSLIPITRIGEPRKQEGGR